MRTTVKALHLGKPVVWQVEEITHFTHADKYVTAHHADGRELLLTDTIKDLAEEFAGQFTRVSRGVLVSSSRLESAHRRPERIEGTVFVRGVAEHLPCSRSYMRDVERFIIEQQGVAQ